MDGPTGRQEMTRLKVRVLVHCSTRLLFLVVALATTLTAQPTPLLDTTTKVDWWFVFKFNSASFPNSCAPAQRACPFGGRVQPFAHFSQQFAYASSDNHTIQPGGSCLGDGFTDPVGATFNQVYNGTYFYVLWNDQFYGDPLPTKGAPAGHSKGMLAWDDDGNGVVLQVTTPDWPGSGSAQVPRKTDGNTLGCTSKDNDILVSQHFFALKLNRSDLGFVLKALQNASVVTDPTNRQIVNNGGPADIQSLVGDLGKKSPSDTPTKDILSTGVILVSKPSNLNVPPRQLVSAELDGEPLRAATWWANPKIPTTTAKTKVGCWDSSLGTAGAVEIATAGTWMDQTIGLTGTATPGGNHAKIGVSIGNQSYSIFGDMNQQGSLSGPNCKSSQNGRGGLFFVIDDTALHNSIANLIKGSSAATKYKPRPFLINPWVESSFEDPALDIEGATAGVVNPGSQYGR
jgi:hypothetical protein